MLPGYTLRQAPESSGSASSVQDCGASCSMQGLDVFDYSSLTQGARPLHYTRLAFRPRGWFAATLLYASCLLPAACCLVLPGMGLALVLRGVFLCGCWQSAHAEQSATRRRAPCTTPRTPWACSASASTAAPARPRARSRGSPSGVGALPHPPDVRHLPRSPSAGVHGGVPGQPAGVLRHCRAHRYRSPPQDPRALFIRALGYQPLWLS